MFYIVGLGNPGEKYQNTRHNVGWLALDRVIDTCGLPGLVHSSQYAGRISEGVLAGQDISVLYPDTFMNNSGSAVVKLVPADQVSNLVVVYDDVDLGVGEIKISVGRGDGGHNGIKSIIQSLGSKEFVRVRIGIAPRSFWSGEARRPAAAALSRHVLGNFSRKEERQLEAVYEKVTEVIKCLVTDGSEAAMNQFN